MMHSKKTLSMVQTSLLAALIVIMAFTPFLGYIPLGFMRATTIHIPVIIGSLLLGPVSGAVLGFTFGLTSFISSTINPNVTSFLFTPFYSLGGVHGGFGSLIICFVPRILVGVVPYYVYKLFGKFPKKSAGAQLVALGTAGCAGSMTNTLLVMNFIYFFFKEEYAAVRGVEAGSLYWLILGVIGTNGVPEAILAAVIVSLVTRALLRSKIVKR